MFSRKHIPALTALLCIATFSLCQVPEPQFGQFQPTPMGQSYNPSPSYNSAPQANPYGSALQPRTAGQMTGYSSRKDNDNTLDEIKNEPGYYHPGAENNFNQMNPAMRTEREMVDLLRETERNDYEIGSAKYYSSSTYLNDLPNYLKAKEKLTKMLNGEIPVSIKDAYFLAESAYGNLYLSYDAYNNIIKESANFIKQWLKENGYNTKDPEALQLGIQKFLSDTLTITQTNPDNTFLKKKHFPFYYDYIDYESKEDRRNYFVTKTLATGTGQCHTLPTTYLILAEALGVQTYLSYNPVHSFIRYKNNKGTVVNYETTVDRFLPDQFYLETLPAMAKAKKNKIYMNNLNRKQVVATVMIDLAVDFVREHWLADEKFIKDCMKTAAPFFPEKDFINTSYLYLNKRLYAENLNEKIKEKGINDLRQIEKYPDVMQAYIDYRTYMEKVSSLGVQDFPEGEYMKMMEYYDMKKKLQTAKHIDAKSKKNLFITY